MNSYLKMVQIWVGEKFEELGNNVIVGKHIFYTTPVPNERKCWPLKGSEIQYMYFRLVHWCAYSVIYVMALPFYI